MSRYDQWDKIWVLNHFKTQFLEINQIWYTLLQQQVNQQISRKNQLLMLQQVPKMPKTRFFFAKTEKFSFWDF